MDLYIAKIPLVKNITCLEVWNIIKTWLLNSPHYGISKINYDFQEEFHVDTSSNTRLSILHVSMSDNKILATRFENFENDKIWKTDYIFFENTCELSIKVSCSSKTYDGKILKSHKPHIIKTLFDKNLVYKETDIYPIMDKPIFLNGSNDIIKCANIIKGEFTTYLPVVYISYDSWNPNKYAVNPDKLAISLSGSAHVLVESNSEFANDLRKECESKNVYHGFIGIYYPKASYKEVISYKDYFINNVLSQESVMKAVIESLQRATLNHAGVDELTWDRLNNEYSKQKILKNEKLVFDSKKELEEYLHNFDNENEQLKEKNMDLIKELDRKNLELDILKNKYESSDCVNLKYDKNEFYCDEYKDLILNILDQVKEITQEGTRINELIKSIMSSNSFSNIGKKIFSDIKIALKEKSLSRRRQLLKKCGFEVTIGAHDKIVFKDNKYSFTVSNSPSDHRNDNNLFSDISKKLDIYRKLF